MLALLPTAALLLSASVLGGSGSDWINTGTGSWSDPTNWTPERVPDANFGDEPTIDNGGTARVSSVDLPVIGRLTIGENNVGSLEIVGGTLESDGFATLGRNSGSQGALTVSGAGSSLTVSAGLNVGRVGDATVVVESGGGLTSNTSMSVIDTILAENTGSTATVTVRGTGSVWNANDDLRIAMPATGAFGTSGGSATLTISNGGTVASKGGTLARGDVADATVTITDAGSTWNADGFDIFVGSGSAENSAELIVEGGGRLVARNVNINPPGAQPDARVLRVGTGAAPGILDVRSVAGPGSGGGLLKINHDRADYHLTSDGTSSGMPVKLESGLAFRHIGPGTTIISSSNETNGTFDIDNGIVVVEGTFFAGGFIFDPVFNVNAGGVLAGSGSVRGFVNVAGGGTIAPGASAGTLATNNLTLDAGAVLDYELAAPGTMGSGVNDRIDSDGNVVLDGTLNITDAGGFGPGTYRLIDYTGSLTDDGLEIGSAPAGLSYAIDTSTAGQVDLVVTGSNAGILVLPERLGFGGVESGTSSAPAPVLVTSDGSDPLILGSVQLQGSGAAAFSISEDLCSGQTLAAGADCDIALTFAATGIGLKLAWLEIPSNAAERPARVPLIGYAVTADNLFTDSFE